MHLRIKKNAIQINFLLLHLLQYYIYAVAGKTAICLSSSNQYLILLLRMLQ